MSVNSKMTAIADAIRAKTGGVDALTLDQMAMGIADIDTTQVANGTVSIMATYDAANAVITNNASVTGMSFSPKYVALFLNVASYTTNGSDYTVVSPSGGDWIFASLFQYRDKKRYSDVRVQIKNGAVETIYSRGYMYGSVITFLDDGFSVTRSQDASMDSPLIFNGEYSWIAIG